MRAYISILSVSLLAVGGVASAEEVASVETFEEPQAEGEGHEGGIHGELGMQVGSAFNWRGEDLWEGSTLLPSAVVELGKGPSVEVFGFVPTSEREQLEGRDEVDVAISHEFSLGKGAVTPGAVSYITPHAETKAINEVYVIASRGLPGGVTLGGDAWLEMARELAAFAEVTLGWEHELPAGVVGGLGLKGGGMIDAEHGFEWTVLTAVMSTSRELKGGMSWTASAYGNYNVAASEVQKGAMTGLSFAF